MQQNQVVITNHQQYQLNFLNHPSGETQLYLTGPAGETLYDVELIFTGLDVNSLPAINKTDTTEITPECVKLTKKSTENILIDQMKQLSRQPNIYQRFEVIRYEGKTYVIVGAGYGLNGGVGWNKVFGTLGGAGQVAGGVALTVFTGPIGGIAGSALVGSGIGGIIYSATTSNKNMTAKGYAKECAIGGVAGAVSGGVGALGGAVVGNFVTHTAGRAISYVLVDGAASAAGTVARKATRNVIEKRPVFEGVKAQDVGMSFLGGGAASAAGKTIGHLARPAKKVFYDPALQRVQTYYPPMNKAASRFYGGVAGAGVASVIRGAGKIAENKYYGRKWNQSLPEAIADAIPSGFGAGARGAGMTFRQGDYTAIFGTQYIPRPSMAKSSPRQPKKPLPQIKQQQTNIPQSNNPPTLQPESATKPIPYSGPPQTKTCDTRDYIEFDRLVRREQALEDLRFELEAEILRLNNQLGDELFHEQQNHAQTYSPPNPPPELVNHFRAPKWVSQASPVSRIHVLGQKLEAIEKAIPEVRRQRKAIEARVNEDIANGADYTRARTGEGVRQVKGGTKGGFTHIINGRRRVFHNARDITHGRMNPQDIKDTAQQARDDIKRQWARSPEDTTLLHDTLAKMAKDDPHGFAINLASYLADAQVPGSGEAIRQTRQKYKERKNGKSNYQIFKETIDANPSIGFMTPIRDPNPFGRYQSGMFGLANTRANEAYQRDSERLEKAKKGNARSSIEVGAILILDSTPAGDSLRDIGLEPKDLADLANGDETAKERIARSVIEKQMQDGARQTAEYFREESPEPTHPDTRPSAPPARPPKLSSPLPTPMYLEREFTPAPHPFSPWYGPDAGYPAYAPVPPPSSRNTTSSWSKKGEFHLGKNGQQVTPAAQGYRVDNTKTYVPLAPVSSGPNHLTTMGLEHHTSAEFSGEITAKPGEVSAQGKMGMGTKVTVLRDKRTVYGANVETECSTGAHLQASGQVSANKKGASASGSIDARASLLQCNTTVTYGDCVGTIRGHVVSVGIQANAGNQYKNHSGRPTGGVAFVPPVGAEMDLTCRPIPRPDSRRGPVYHPRSTYLPPHVYGQYVPVYGPFPPGYR